MNKIKLSNDFLSHIKDSLSAKCKQNSTKLKEIYFAKLEEGFNPIEAPTVETSYTAGVYVSWGDAVLARRDFLLATSGISECSGLVILDQDSQYLLHALPRETSTEQIEHSLNKVSALGKDFHQSEIYLLPGELASTTALKILEVLFRLDPSLIEKISLTRDFERYSAQGVEMLNGNMFKYRSTNTMFGFHSDLCDQNYYSDGFEQLIY